MCLNCSAKKYLTQQNISVISVCFKCNAKRFFKVLRIFLMAVILDRIIVTWNFHVVSCLLISNVCLFTMFRWIITFLHSLFIELLRLFGWQRERLVPWGWPWRPQFPHFSMSGTQINQMSCWMLYDGVSYWWLDSSALQELPDIEP